MLFMLEIEQLIVNATSAVAAVLARRVRCPLPGSDFIFFQDQFKCEALKYANVLLLSARRALLHVFYRLVVQFISAERSQWCHCRIVILINSRKRRMLLTLSTQLATPYYRKEKKLVESEYQI